MNIFTLRVYNKIVNAKKIERQIYKDQNINICNYLKISRNG